MIKLKSGFDTVEWIVFGGLAITAVAFIVIAFSL